MPLNTAPKPNPCSAVNGAVILGVFHCSTGAICFWFLLPEYSGTTAMYLGLWLRFMAGVFWGALLGRAVGRALAAVGRGERSLGKRDLIGAGARCSVVNGGFYLLLAAHYLCIVGASPPDIDRYLLKLLIGFSMANICLQASLLVFAAGILLPRDEAQTVQVTEKLRL
jgi:hypothetical protein